QRRALQVEGQWTCGVRGRAEEGGDGQRPMAKSRAHGASIVGESLVLANRVALEIRRGFSRLRFSSSERCRSEETKKPSIAGRLEMSPYLALVLSYQTASMLWPSGSSTNAA